MWLPARSPAPLTAGERLDSPARMLRTLALLRHGRASGQGLDAALTPEGIVQLQKVAAVLRAEGWRPATILASPLTRAMESARTVAAGLGLERQAVVLRELAPDSEPVDALHAIDAAAHGSTSILVVSHLPLVARIAHELTGDEISFTPATFAEIADQGDGTARLVRRLSPDEF